MEEVGLADGCGHAGLAGALARWGLRGAVVRAREAAVHLLLADLRKRVAVADEGEERDRKDPDHEGRAGGEGKEERADVEAEQAVEDVLTAAADKFALRDSVEVGGRARDAMRGGVVSAHAGLGNDGCAALGRCGGCEGAGHLAHRVTGLHGAAHGGGGGAIAGLRAGCVGAVLQGGELATEDVDRGLWPVDLRAQQRRCQHGNPHCSDDEKDDFAHVCNSPVISAVVRGSEQPWQF